MGHVDVHRGVTLAHALTVVDGLVDRQKPAVGLVGDDGVDPAAREQRGQVLHEGLVEGHDLAGLPAGGVVGVRVKHHVAAVLENAVHVAELHVVRAVHQPLQYGLGLQIALGGLALFDVLVHPVVVEALRHHLHHAPGQLLLLLDGGVGEVDVADAGHHEGGDDHAGHHQQYDLEAQGHAAGGAVLRLVPGLAGQGRLVPVGKMEPLPGRRGDGAQDQRDGQHGDGLVDDVDQHVRRKLGPEHAPSPVVEYPVGQRRGDAPAEAQAIEHEGQHRADAAADDGEGQYDDGEPRGLFVESLRGVEGGGHGDEHGQRAVVGGLDVAHAVDDVRQKAHDDAGDVAAQRRDERAADVVQIQRQTEPPGQMDAQDIDQQSAQAQREHAPPRGGLA